MSERGFTEEHLAEARRQVEQRAERSVCTEIEIEERALRLAKRARGEPDGTVYFVQGRPFSPVKIGFTQYNDVTSRLKGLQTGNPDTLSVLVSLPGSQKDERAIHKVLAPERLNGEWFEFSARTVELIKRAQRQGLKSALEAIAALQAPDAPLGWEKLCVSETGAFWTLSLPKYNVLPLARRAGTGPTFREVRQGKSTRSIRRYYNLAELKRWLVANQIPHRVEDHFWRMHVTEEPT